MGVKRKRGDPPSFGGPRADLLASVCEATLKKGADPNQGPLYAGLLGPYPKPQLRFRI